MKRAICKTREAAIEAAKQECIKRAGAESLPIPESAWQIRDTSTHCGCGETEAVDVTLFLDFEQHGTYVGICSYCGEE